MDREAEQFHALADAPEASRPALTPLTLDQAQALLRAAAGDRWEALYVVALSLGLRQGEVLGRRWGDLDLEARELRVRSNLQRDAGGLALSPLKTGSRGRRVLALPSRCTMALRVHREQQGEARGLAGPAWEERDLMFCTSLGRPLGARNVVRAFKALLGRAGLPRRRRPHGRGARGVTATFGYQPGYHAPAAVARTGAIPRVK